MTLRSVALGGGTSWLPNAMIPAMLPEFGARPPQLFATMWLSNYPPRGATTPGAISVAYD
ncbi:hypothetical protein Pve01_79480 [Planomonospora venezuelensis]|nr:hypothetical protein Pve01_79480 [Planomonospora venezuelensis]